MSWGVVLLNAVCPGEVTVCLSYAASAAVETAAAAGVDRVCQALLHRISILFLRYKPNEDTKTEAGTKWRMFLGELVSLVYIANINSPASQPATSCLHLNQAEESKRHREQDQVMQREGEWESVKEMPATCCSVLLTPARLIKLQDAELWRSRRKVLSL